jgi:hypothetical protein
MTIVPLNERPDIIEAKPWLAEYTRATTLPYLRVTVSDWFARWMMKRRGEEQYRARMLQRRGRPRRRCRS